MEVPAAQQPASEMQFKPTQDTNKIRLNESDYSKVGTIGAGLNQQ